MRRFLCFFLMVALSYYTCIAQTNKEFTVGEETFVMIFVEGGTFTMGATVDQGSNYKDNEKPCHKVTLSDFYIGQTEVTQALWIAVMGYNPSARQEDVNCPVENVSWGDCMEFINKLNEMTGQNFRLPTESEWEFAARGGNKSNWYRYSGSNRLDEVAWRDNTILHDGWADYALTHPVGGKKANELGIHDMSTNVAEWCSDFWGYWPKEFAVRPQTNPTGAKNDQYTHDGRKITQHHVVRGLVGGDDFNHRICRREPKQGADQFTGFRLALGM